MIRPFTLICMVLASGSGLYLYQCKHQAQLLDREIAKTVKQTETTRERIGMLRAEWALLNEPDRLADLARAHTALHTLQPAQFVAMNDLAAKLPAPGLPGGQNPPMQAEPEEMPAVATFNPPPAKHAQVATILAEPKPVVATPEAKQAVAAAEPKTAPGRHASRPASVQLAEEPAPTHPPSRPRAAASVLPAGVNSEATAPGTVGAAVLRAMRANGYGAASAPSYVKRGFAPAAAYAPAASYAAPTAGSLLGRAGGSLPPPVPFAAR